MDGALEAAARGNAQGAGVACGGAAAETRLISGRARSTGEKGTGAAGEPKACGRKKKEPAGGAREAAPGARERQGDKTVPRTSAKVEELPDEAREAIDRMLSDGGCTYQRIVDELAKAGFFVAKGAVGRREAGRAADERMERLFERQLDALGRLIEKQSGFDAAGAALKLVIGKLGRRIGDEAGLFDEMPAEKAAAGLIQAARVAIQYEKMAGDRKRLRVQAREEAVRELREALMREPELWERIEKLAAGGA